MVKHVHIILEDSEYEKLKKAKGKKTWKEFMEQEMHIVSGICSRWAGTGCSLRYNGKADCQAPNTVICPLEEGREHR